MGPPPMGRSRREFGSKHGRPPSSGTTSRARPSGCVEAQGWSGCECVEPDAVALVEFLAPLGMVLGYYGGDAGTHPDHAGIWKVRYEPSAAERGEGHAVDGDLPVHSSQSLRAERPPFFAMLMVNPGWQNLAPGLRG